MPNGCINWDGCRRKTGRRADCPSCGTLAKQAERQKLQQMANPILWRGHLRRQT